jgi:hypothetical protein
LDVGRPENKRRKARIAAMLAGGSSFQQVKRQFFWIMQSAPGCGTALSPLLPT